MRTVAVNQAQMGLHARHVEVVVCLTVIAVCLVVAALLIYVQITGIGKPRCELSEWQIRRFERKGRL